MKKPVLFFLSLFFSLSLFSKPLHWKETFCLYDHLVEVNKEWLKVTADEFLCDPVSFENDRQRIQIHLRLVEKYLRENPPTGLNKKQLENRNAALDILHTYQIAGVFPQNTLHKARQPYFKDIYGTFCAVGQLAFKTGGEALVEQISEEMNYAYIHELKDHFPGLSDWAQEYGFTVEEMAWIQPGYPPEPQLWLPVGNGGGFEGQINVIRAQGDDNLFFAGDFSIIDGVATNSIIGWDGNDWFTLGDGVDGEIHDIFIDQQGTVYAVGNFSVNSNPLLTNVAFWKNGTWEGFYLPGLTGTIYSIYQSGNRLYLGGDFEIPNNNNPISQLAYINLENNLLENQNGDLSVDGTVYSIREFEGQLYITGDFNHTAPQTNNGDINQWEAYGVATWSFDESIQTYNWTQVYQHPLALPLTATYRSSNMVYFSSGIDEASAPEFGIYNGTDWFYFNLSKIDPDLPVLVKGIVNHQGILIAYGNFYINEIITIFTQGTMVVENQVNGANGAYFDGAVTAAESFRGKIYFAGPFTNVQDQDFPGLVASPYGIVTSTTRPFESSSLLEVSSSNSKLHIQYENEIQNAVFSIYDLNGRLIHIVPIESGSGQKVISTQNWASGMYVYQIVGDGILESGKVVVF